MRASARAIRSPSVVVVLELVPQGQDIDVHGVDVLVQDHTPAAAEGHDELVEEGALAYRPVQKRRSLELTQAGQHGRSGGRQLS